MQITKPKTIQSLNLFKGHCTYITDEHQLDSSHYVKYYCT